MEVFLQKMPVQPFFITREQLNLFHDIDRQLYTILTLKLWRDPMESMQIMALWIWLERMGCRLVVKEILSLPIMLIADLVDEALLCLKCIDNVHFVPSPGTLDIPLMQGLMAIPVSMRYFQEKRVVAAQEISVIMNEVCFRAFSDITQQAVENIAATQSMADSQLMVTMKQAMSPEPTLPPELGFDPIEIVQPWPQVIEVPPEERTMFLTFSKGYPVSEWEVRDFFTRTYGDCIVSVHMQEVEPLEQSLFARIIFISPVIIERILSGVDKAKFTINGKHVWARKFIPKRPRASVSAMQPPSTFAPRPY